MKNIDGFDEKEFIRNRIFYLRNSKNYSARNLSLELGMSSEYVNQAENGRLTPSLDFIINLCRFFNISIFDFFNEQPFVLEYKEFLDELKKMSQTNLQLLLQLAKALNKSEKVL